MKEMITLNTQEQKRVMVLNQILAGHLSAAEAAPLAPRVDETGAAHSGSVSKGGRSRGGPREPRSQAQTYNWRRSAKAGDRPGPNDLPGLQSTASTRLAGRTRGDQALAGQCASHPASGRIADRAEATQAAASTSTQAICESRHAGADRREPPRPSRGSVGRGSA